MAADAQSTLSVESIESYFAEIVQKSIVDQALNITGEAQFYLVTLLSEFAVTDRLYRPDGDGGVRQREALALLLAQAETAPDTERARLLKRLGDSSLYISGFFAESLARSLVDVDYYIVMGGNAYSTLSDMLRVRRPTTAPAQVFAELAVKFPSLVEVLSQVSASSSALNATNESILKLYDLWLRTGSPRLADKLRARGLDPAATVREPGHEQ